MRRILLGGLGIVLGVFARPAFAQQPRANPAQPPVRAAALGRPSAVPDPQPQQQQPQQPESEITQTGLLRNGPSRPVTTYAPGSFGAPTPVVGSPPTVGGAVVGAPVVDVTPMVQPTPPRTVPGTPSVTESRDVTGRVPGAVYVPSVAPGYDCPVGLDEPLYGCDPGATAVDRVASTRRGKPWVSAELLMWWSRSPNVPPLVTTSSPQFNGIAGQGDTRVLLGGTFGESFRVGGRIGAGYWFDEGECRGVDARLFWLAPTTETFTANTNQYPLLARPFFNINAGTAPSVPFGSASEIVAGPGVATGSVTAQMKSTVWGAEANYRRFLVGDSTARIDGLAGFRYLGVRDQLNITEQFNRIPGSDATVGIPATSGIIMDSFRTSNQFYGGQLGVAGTWQRGRWSLDPRATIAFGTVHQEIEVNGAQVLAFPNGTVTTTSGGLLAVNGANIGKFSQNKFAVVPEVGLNVGWQATDRLKLFVGYNFLYLSSAVRPGDAIDTRLDAARVPNLLPAGTVAPLAGVVRPQPQFSTNGYFVQGISFGLVYRW